MKTNFVTIIMACFMITAVFSQTSVNNYRYIIVSKKFDFQKEKNQYQLNDLAKFLFNKYGFEAVIEGSEYPEDLALNRCLALTSDVNKGQGMFKTKLTMQLTDCNDKVVFTSDIGESREKVFKTAYNLALREAFKSVEALHYKYVPNKNITSVSITSQLQPQANPEATQEIQELRQEIQNLKKEKEKEVEVAVVETSKVESPKVISPQSKLVVKQVKETTIIEGASNVLYAQAIDNGFQLVDSSPKVVYRIKSTNLKDVFLVEATSAVVYKKGNDWVLEYYSGATLKQESLNIKF